MSPELPAPRDVFLASLGRCARQPEFMPSFYTAFMETSETIREKFRDTNFSQQHQMLIRSLTVSAGAASGDPAALREVRERGMSHRRAALDIAPELYTFWLDSLLETAARFDARWNTEIEQCWRRILGYVINSMTRHYETP